MLNRVCQRKRHGTEKKRLKKQREKKEVKWMFGQMEKDSWELMEWVKEAEETRPHQALFPSLYLSAPSSCPLLRL